MRLVALLSNAVPRFDRLRLVTVLAVALVGLSVYLAWFNGGDQLPELIPPPLVMSECGVAIDVLAASSSSELVGGYRYKVGSWRDEGEPFIYFDVPEGYTFKLATEPSADASSSSDYTIGIVAGNWRLVIDPSDGEEISRRVPRSTDPLNDVFTEIMDSVCVDTPDAVS